MGSDEHPIRCVAARARTSVVSFCKSCQAVTVGIIDDAIPVGKMSCAGATFAGTGEAVNRGSE